MERRKFTREFKLEAIKLIRDRGVGVPRFLGKTFQSPETKVVVEPVP